MCIVTILFDHAAQLLRVALSKVPPDWMLSSILPEDKQNWLAKYHIVLRIKMMDKVQKKKIDSLSCVP